MRRTVSAVGSESRSAFFYRATCEHGGVTSVWINGTLYPPETASVGAFDHGLTTGDGAFESMELVGGIPFAPTRHLRRLARSAEALGLRIPYDDQVLRDALAEVGSEVQDRGVLRLTLTGGNGPLGSGRSDVTPSVIIAATGGHAPWGNFADVHVVPWVRNERGAMSGVKSTSYAENVVALATAKAAGANEAIFANTVGDLCEGTGTNVFVVMDGELVTPPLSSGCLAGVTRELLLETLDVSERPIPLAALSEASEAFLTSSTRRVQPIRNVDNVTLAECPGPFTLDAAAKFNDLLVSSLDP
jgi:branched-chain amino acid aminotransferase